MLNRILAQLQRGEIQIPAVPSVVTELRDLVARNDSKLEAVVALLERDPALVARVLQLGRSAAVSRSTKVLDLGAIVNRVGFRQIHNVVETVWSNDCFKIPDARYAPYASRLVRHSVARALAMRALADAQRLDGFAAYLAGLFADVGAAFLLWAIVDKSRGNAPDPEDALVFVREHHEAIGSAVLRRWGHGDALIALVRRHHAPGPPAPGSVFTSLFIVAAQLANQLTREEDLTVDPPWPPPELLERCIPVVGAERHLEIATRLNDEYAATLDTLHVGA